MSLRNNKYNRDLLLAKLRAERNGDLIKEHFGYINPFAVPDTDLEKRKEDLDNRWKSKMLKAKKYRAG